MDETKSDFRRVFRHARKVAGWLILLLVLLYLASGFYSVKPQQRGVLKRFGRVVNDSVPPGMHYHWPWPIETVVRLRTTEIRSIMISYGKKESALGQPTQAAAGEVVTGAGTVLPAEIAAEETVQSAVGQAATRQEGPSEVSPTLEATALLSGDENLVLTRLLIQYTIDQPRGYLYNTTDAEGVVHRIAHGKTISTYAGMGVDAVLTTGRLEIQKKLKELIQAKADDYGLGVRIASVQVLTVEPPAYVADAFRDVASAREDKHRLVQEAEGDRNRRLPMARAKANRMRTEAEAYAKEVEDRAQGEAQRFVAAWEQYRKAKSVTATRLYLEALEETLQKVRKVVASPDAERYLLFPRTHLSEDLSPPAARKELSEQSSSHDRHRAGDEASGEPTE
jgi:membrane protease subunit HflK